MNSTHSDIRPLLAVTAGDVAGIGPEVIVRAAVDPRVQQAARLLLLCHPQILEQAAELSGIECSIVSVPNDLRTAADFDSLTADHTNSLFCLDPVSTRSAALLSAPRRQVSAAAGDAAFTYLTTAIELAQQGTVDAIATAPLNKESLHAAGHNFPGHTEILAKQCDVTDYAMMLYLPETRLQPLRALVCGAAKDGDSPPPLHGLSINHVTLHTSISSVPHLLSTDAVREKIELLNRFLDRLGCPRKAISVCALNPHGGEHGLFGDEEAGVIEPAVAAAIEAGLNVRGPFPVDTLVRRAVAGEFDGLVAMYHDQGHIPVKLIGFDAAVNITLGLPIIRTSPTHGTAFDRAWDPTTPADASGMIEAILTAVQLHRGRR